MRSWSLLPLFLIGCSSSDFSVSEAEDATGDSVEDSSGSEIGGGDTEPVADAPIDDVPVTDGSTVDAGSPTCNPAEAVDMAAVFVSATTGDDAGGDGSASSPVKTIARATLVMKAKGATHVVLDQGTYTEPVVISDHDPGVLVEGGWKRVGATWSRQCGADVRALTLIQSPSAVGVAIKNLTKRSGLAHLTVLTKASSDKSQTLIGVLVRGPGTIFYLDDVSVRAFDGGPGQHPDLPPTTPPPSCDGLTTCSTVTSTPLAGMPGMDGKGVFIADGYVAGNGGTGTDGGSGSNGTPGSLGASSATNECNWGCSGSAGCDSSKLTTTVGGKGKCGCGGVGGKGAQGGTGGGASIGVHAFGASVTIDVKRSSITAGNGGNGSGGAGGAAPSSPTVGSAGASAVCHTGGCTGTVMACYYVASKDIAGGAAGGAGSAGAAGGNGGGGAGGPAVGIVTGGGAFATTDSTTTLAFGTPGKGGGTAPAGVSGAKYVAP